MRVGKWVRIYQQRLPVPGRMGMAFGLFENSELHLVPLMDVANKRKHEPEIMVTPVPLRSWRSVCRLSVRLKDTSHALAIATGFLRDEGINILLSECCSTYQDRAHFDAICDLSQMGRYKHIAAASRETFELTIRQFLEKLTERYEQYAEDEAHSNAFLLDTADYVKFSPLTGLNDAWFVADHDAARTAHHRAGALEIPDALVTYLSLACGYEPPGLPQYALVTGNTEQRYMRVLFLREHRHMFRLIVNNDLPGFAGSGVGVLNQFLTSLPLDVNLMRASNYIFDKRDDIERGRIDLIGHWDVTHRLQERETIEACLEREFKSILDNLVVVDMQGNSHRNALSFVKASNAKTAYPRVYVSYSLSGDMAMRDYLMSALSDNNYDPILGTEQGADVDDWRLGDRPVGSDVMEAALRAINSCVALVSLQTKREDYKVTTVDGDSRYIVPPWLTAEEMYAWSSQTQPLVLRLRDVNIYNATFNRNISEETFDVNKPATFKLAVTGIINRLNDFKRTDGFPRLKHVARLAQYRDRFAPPEY